MGGCAVSTGYVQNAPRAGKVDCVNVAPGKQNLFSPETAPGTQFSSAFTISPGMVGLIEAYNMVNDLSIYVNRVIRSSLCPPIGSSCDPCAMGAVFGNDGAISYTERMTLGDPAKWSLFKASADEGVHRTQLLIAVPGIYQLELEDSAAQLGSMDVELQLLSVDELCHLPSEYFAGV